MKQVSPEQPSDEDQAEFHLKLFVAEGEPNSTIAQENLRRLQEARFQGPLVVEIVDVLENYQAALDARVLVTPCLVLHSPQPRVIVVGTLKDREKVIAALGLVEQKGCSE